VKEEPSAVAPPFSTSPASSEAGSETTAVGPTPSFASVAEVSVANSCGPTPVGLGGEEDVVAHSGMFVKTEAESEVSELKVLGSCVRSLSYSCTLALGRPVPIKHVAGKMVNIRYKPSRHSPHIYTRLHGNAVTGEISSCGMLKIQGARSQREAQRSMQTLAKELKKALPPSDELSLKDQRVVVKEISAQVDLGFRVNIDEMSQVSSERILKAWYDPNVSPSLNIYLREPRATLMVYHTGKCQIRGVSNLGDLKQSLDFLREIAKQYAF
jgi:TATA-box binding protein (TBP) (component of TFIID and TFIIIB)